VWSAGDGGVVTPWAAQWYVWGGVTKETVQAAWARRAGTL